MMECWKRGMLGKDFQWKGHPRNKPPPYFHHLSFTSFDYSIFTSLSLHPPISLLPHRPVIFSPYLLSAGERVNILQLDLAHSSISLRVISFCCRMQKSA